jgi:hypothetical protein
MYLVAQPDPGRLNYPYAHWRDVGCDALTPQAAAADEHCARLKAELDIAEGAVRLVTEGLRSVPATRADNRGTTIEPLRPAQTRP